MLTFLSGVAWTGSSPAALQAQPATETVTLDTLSVEGAGTGRNAAGSQPGGAVGPVRGYVATQSGSPPRPIPDRGDGPVDLGDRPQADRGPERAHPQPGPALHPSVTTEQRGGAGATRLDQFYIRGFPAPLFLDGLALPGSRDAGPSIDPYRVERIDVIKGPSSVLYGQAGAGGVVNFVSKVPRFAQHGEIFVQGGGFNEVRGGFDIGGPSPPRPVRSPTSSPIAWSGSAGRATARRSRPRWSASSSTRASPGGPRRIPRSPSSATTSATRSRASTVGSRRWGRCSRATSATATSAACR